ncbi:MAG TPA: hypothetical protein VLV83_13590 [Acidobacteriota bacterium]|nr:hypothetical protein [Acidobacteriota bacterium]
MRYSKLLACSLFAMALALSLIVVAAQSEGKACPYQPTVQQEQPQAQPAQGRPMYGRQGQGQRHRHGQGHHGQGAGQRCDNPNCQHRGAGPGQCPDCPQGMMNDPDHQDFRFLLDNRQAIDRQVHQLENGVETLTESDDPQVAARIRKHVRAMYQRLEEGRPIHARDPLFAEIFRHVDQIDLEMEDTEKGIRVRETAADPQVVKLIKAHAEVVNLFIENGHAEMHRNHEVP